MPPFDPPAPAAPAPGPKDPAPPPVAPCSCNVSITPNPLTLCNVATGTLTATGTPAGGTFEWQSSDTKIVTVSASGGTGTVTYVATGSATITAKYTPPGCPSCSATATVNACKCTPKPGGGRYYSNAKKSEASLIGISAKVKTRYGKICCETCSTIAGYAVAYVNITKTGGEQKWAQTGYGRERNDGSAAIKKYRYAEKKGDTYKVKYDTDNPPAEGSFHTYQCELDKATGTWSYFQDGGTRWWNFQDDFWKTNLGDFFQYTGEIFNKEDDMPGTDADKCTFTECKIKKDGAAAYVDAGLAAGDMGNHDAAEWGEEFVSATAINIWDKKPLP